MNFINTAVNICKFQTFYIYIRNFTELNSEFRVKKRKSILLGGLLAGLALVLTSCLFESDENGVDSWLSDHGMPSSYKVQVVNVEGIKVSSVEAFLDTTAKAADSRAVFGAYSNLRHDMVLDFGFSPASSFYKNFTDSDSAGAFLQLFWDRGLYTSKEYPKDSLPISEDVNVTFSWKLDNLSNKKALDSLIEISDANWRKSLEWEDVASADTTISISVSAKDTSIRLPFPSALVDSLKLINKGAIHLQLRLSAPEAKHVFRFLGDNTYYPPLLTVYSDSSDIYADTSKFVAPTPFRMAGVAKSLEDCSECAVLHGGVYDSLVVELPPEPILKALSDFYGDEFPYTEGNGNDVRQSVLFAQLAMARDDSKGNNELGLPIQVVVGSFVDSANTTVRRMENYRIDNATILEKGHQNLVFHDGDSLTFQLTYGLKDFVNKASDGRGVRFIMRLGYPFLQEMDTTYATHLTKDGDTSYVFLSHFDYARYDFSSSLEQPVSLKLWLASKRGDEE